MRSCTEAPATRPRRNVTALPANHELARDSSPPAGRVVVRGWIASRARRTSTLLSCGPRFVSRSGPRNPPANGPVRERYALWATASRCAQLWSGLATTVAQRARPTRTGSLPHEAHPDARNEATTLAARASGPANQSSSLRVHMDHAGLVTSAAKVSTHWPSSIYRTGREVNLLCFFFPAGLYSFLRFLQARISLTNA